MPRSSPGRRRNHGLSLEPGTGVPHRTESAMRIAAPLILVAAVGCGLLASAPTHAYDQKVMAPVTACIAYGPDTTSAELQFAPSGIYNPGTTSEKVVCSMPRDQETAYTTNQVGIIVNYRVLGATPAKMTCTLYVGSAQHQTD